MNSKINILLFIQFLQLLKWYLRVSFDKEAFEVAFISQNALFYAFIV
jgi:hypothetical protein